VEFLTSNLRHEFVFELLYLCALTLPEPLDHWLLRENKLAANMYYCIL